MLNNKSQAMETLIILIGKIEDLDNEDSMYLLAVEKTPTAYIRINTNASDSVESLMETIRGYAAKSKFLIYPLEQTEQMLVTIGYNAEVKLCLLPLSATEVLMLELNSS